MSLSGIMKHFLQSVMLQSSCALKSVTKELISLKTNPPEGIQLLLKEDNILDIEALIHGPPSTPYCKGIFKVSLSLPPDFPNQPPRFLLMTLEAILRRKFSIPMYLHLERSAYILHYSRFQL